LPSSMISHVRIADVFSLLNASLGIGAILLLFNDMYTSAFSLILLAILADGLDGIIARKTGKGPLGSYLEAMADMISLCVAPLLFIYLFYSKALELVSSQFLLLVGLLFLLFICSMIRLSSFHILTTDRFFIGLPASATTVILLCLALFPVDLIIMYIIICVLSLALISPVKFPKPDKYVNAVAAVIFLTTALFLSYAITEFLLLLLLVILLYCVAGPLVRLIKKEKKKTK